MIYSIETVNNVILTEVHVELATSLLQLLCLAQNSEAFLLDAPLRLYRIGTDASGLLSSWIAERMTFLEDGADEVPATSARFSVLS